jgi:hypothetical protein
MAQAHKVENEVTYQLNLTEPELALLFNIVATCEIEGPNSRHLASVTKKLIAVIEVAITAGNTALGRRRN